MQEHYKNVIERMHTLSRRLRDGYSHGIDDSILDNIVYDMAKGMYPHLCTTILFQGIRLPEI